ncbi:glycosyltransferase family 2 protein [Paraburkholderia sediminicola]|uniref:hypothetical protein n=1 Tax=Paraburkholderia sediminicola TaxID=458836 RepID=UPI0038BCC288
MREDLALFYLARKVEGLDSFRRFAESYREHAPGCQHELVIIYKGFEGEADITAASAEFADLPHRSVQVTDDHKDIGAYLESAAQIDAEYVCFVNTHTKILAPNWLAHLRNAMRDPDVGLAGATASYESLYESLALTSKIVWLTGIQRVPYDKELASSFRSILEKYSPDWLRDRPAEGQTWRRNGQFHERNLEFKWRDYWKWSISEGQHYDFLNGFPRFPNAHIRSNGFIIRRDVLLDFFRKISTSKRDSYGFESGPDGLSARIARSGKALALVDRNGAVHVPADWPKSRTFRLGNQEDLLMSDNQTKAFDALSPAQRATYQLMSWGDAAVRMTDVNSLGFAFRTSPVTRPAIGETSGMPYIADHCEYGVKMHSVIPDDPAWQFAEVFPDYESSA